MHERRNHTPAFKAKVALAALSGKKAIPEISFEYGVHQTLVYKWVRQLKESAPDIFSREIKPKRSEKKKNCASCTMAPSNLMWNAIF